MRNMKWSARSGFIVTLTVHRASLTHSIKYSMMLRNAIKLKTKQTKRITHCYLTPRLNNKDMSYLIKQKSCAQNVRGHCWTFHLYFRVIVIPESPWQRLLSTNVPKAVLYLDSLIHSNRNHEFLVPVFVTVLRYWTGTSLQPRLIPGVFSSVNDIQLFFIILPA